MKYRKTSLDGVFLAEAFFASDDRGFFVKPYHAGDFSEIGAVPQFREIFFTESKKNVIRGMHFQLPPADHEKMIFPVSGSVTDLVLDLREDSPTYLKFEAFDLSEKNHTGIFIPRGFAHGFLARTDHAVLVYNVTSEHNASLDTGIRYDSFGFDWGIKDPVLSGKDRSLPPLSEFKTPFRMERK